MTVDRIQGHQETEIPLYSLRVFIITIFALVIGLLAGLTAGFAAGVSASPAMGTATGLAVGVVAGLSSWAVTSLGVATSLHALLDRH